jgi:diguanylate cyclase (GGDEF)-like protein/putative nucleotidyltransferase with HDIG domain
MSFGETELWKRRMREKTHKERKFRASVLFKGMALGLLCSTFLLAQQSLHAIWTAISLPLSGRPWSLEDIPAVLARTEGYQEVVSKLGDASCLIPAILIFSTCSLFGLWEGLRAAQIAELRRTAKHERQRVLQVNKQLRELSLTDPLTRLANRRHFFKQLDTEIKRAERYGQSLSCIMVDLDFFKNVNDTFGHQFGDYVLREVAGILKSHCREVDTPARCGGEEFAVLMPNTLSEDAEVLAERLRKAVASHTFAKGEIFTSLTISIGVASWTVEDPVTMEKLIYRADAMLYEVKSSGRNGVLTWERSHHCEKTVCNKYLDEQRMTDLRNRLANFSRDMKHTYLSAVNSLLSAVKVRDNYTLAHSYDVSHYALAISRQLGLSETDSEVINNAANLHDLGKIGMDERILCKPGRLTEKEMEVMKEHPRMAAEILRPLKFLSKEITLIIHHHERYDGAGYPHGLKGEAIPLGSRIIAVADAFSAMTTERPYRRAIPPDKAIEELVDKSGTQFDPQVVKAFVQAVRSGKVALPEPKPRAQARGVAAGEGAPSR